jgi:hypothetical protein
VQYFQVGWIDIDTHNSFHSFRGDVFESVSGSTPQNGKLPWLKLFEQFTKDLAEKLQLRDVGAAHVALIIIG